MSRENARTVDDVFRDVTRRDTPAPLRCTVHNIPDETADDDVKLLMKQLFGEEFQGIQCYKREGECGFSTQDDFLSFNNFVLKRIMIAVISPPISRLCHFENYRLKKMKFLKLVGL